MQKETNSTKKIIFIYLSMFLIVLATSVVLAMYFSYALKLKSENNGEKYDRYYVMITPDRNLDFWKAVYESAYEYGRTKGIIVELMGENLPEEYSVEELMEIAIASQTDGIIVYADESPEITELINKATEQNIPVVTVYGDNTQSLRCCYVGVGSYNLGREYGKQLANMLADMEASLAEDEPKNVKLDVAVLVNIDEENSNQNLVWSGIQSFVESEENNLSGKINLSMKSIDNRNAFTVEESIRDLFKEEEVPDVIVCLNETDTECVYQAVVDYNLVGRVNIIGYYDSLTILKGISRNIIYSSITINTSQMGQYTLNALKEYNENGTTSQYVPIDVTVIDRDNVEDYLKMRGEAAE